MSSNRLRRALATAFAATLAVGGLVMTTSAPATAAPATASSSSQAIGGATFVWGLSGYAQDGIFGPWTFKDFTGQATYLEGNVVNSPANPTPQAEYSVAPVPATSFPTAKADRAANAVKFSNGTGSTTGDVTTISWSGSYTVNAYPAIYNAPNEIYANPTLVINGDGSGALTMNFTIGAGTSMAGTPFEAKNFGRLAIATFDAGSIETTGTNTFRITPDFNGVDSGMENQTTTCSTSNGATGWAGSWPSEFVQALNSHEAGQSVVPHFYSTGCGGKQDNKPALPIDVTYTEATTAASVTVSETSFASDAAATTVTVTGTGFGPSFSQATRAPIAPSGANGKSGGYYIAFAKVADVWRPSAGAPSSTRTQMGQNAADSTKWANPTSNGYNAGPANVVLNEDGSFSATITVDKAGLDLANPPATNTQYGVIVYPAGGGANAATEVLVPITFTDAEEPETPIDFTDVAGTTFASEIAWLSTQGITTGYDNGNGTFSYQPSGSVLREQMAAFLYRYVNDGSNPGADAPGASFVDVPASHVFSKHIAWLADQKITTGYAGNVFRPGQPVLREQMAAFLYRVAGEPPFTAPATSPFADVPTNHTFYKEITWLASTEITTGYTEGGVTTFKGSQPVLREQMAAFLFRFDNLEK